MYDHAAHADQRPATPPGPHRPARHLWRAGLATLLFATGLLTGTVSPAAASSCKPAQGDQFLDVAVDHIFCDEIRVAVDEGWVHGYADGTFQPTAPVTRQAAAAMLWRASNVGEAIVLLPPCTTAPFPDVPVDHPFCPHIRQVAKAGWLTGYADGGFHPSAVLSRQATAAVMTRFPDWNPILPPCHEIFSDVPIGHQFCAEITWLVDEGLASGYPDGTFQPTGAVSRQAFVVILGRTMDLVPAPGS